MNSLLPNLSIIYSLKDLESLRLQVSNNMLPPDIYIKDGVAMPLLSYAVQEADYSLIELLLEKKVNVNSVIAGPSPLIQAIIGGNPQLINLLLELKADINLVCNTYPSTPLMACAFISDNKLCQTLLSMGARPELDASSFGNKPNTALYVAIRENNVEMCQMLIDYYPENYPIIERMEIFESMLGNNEHLENRHIAIDYIKIKKEKSMLLNQVPIINDLSQNKTIKV